ncbi:trypsin-like peptidase [Nitrospirillum amazonense]|uniref:Trypsin-like peptidase n=1 Tax=Nitrospirillum amazonense TaxID=28077 RepID=A0A560K3T5_9PROT|nr:serine protease [Nitrospirillum amazonense]TWB75270.1 trypsin-like peptidase [Nitrospirillum amazonense]
MENVAYCTTKIIGVGEGRKPINTGTGFIFGYDSGSNGSVPVLITNKHVVEGTKEIAIRLHTAKKGEKKPSGSVNALIPGGGSGQWYFHPDPNVDICAIIIGQVLGSDKVNAFYRMIKEENIPTQTQLESLDLLEDVIMMGYPIGLSDELNNYPIIRRGITASHPAVRFNGKPIVVVDMACFPGSSGSPIFIYNRGFYTDKNRNTTAGQDRLFFLGILASGPVMKSSGEITMREIPTALTPVPLIDTMINLGYVFKSSEILNMKQGIFQKYGLKTTP